MLNSVTWRGDERVLDVGCGNGFLLNEAAKHLTTGLATGIDVWKAEAGAQTADLALGNARLEGVADAHVPSTPRSCVSLTGSRSRLSTRADPKNTTVS